MTELPDRASPGKKRAGLSAKTIRFYEITHLTAQE